MRRTDGPFCLRWATTNCVQEARRSTTLIQCGAKIFASPRVWGRMQFVPPAPLASQSPTRKAWCGRKKRSKSQGPVAGRCLLDLDCASIRLLAQASPWQLKGSALTKLISSLKS